MNLLRDEQLDDLQIKDLKIIQKKTGFKFGIDAVLLANSAKIGRNKKIVDLGTGTGVIPLIIAGKTSNNKIYGLEIQKDIAKMAERSIMYNSLEDSIEIINEDLKKASQILGKNQMDIVLSNPPYFKDAPKELQNPDIRKLISRHEVKCNLEDIIKSASSLLRFQGSFYMIHRPSRLIEIVTVLRKYELEPKEIRFIHPRENKDANLLIIHSRKKANQEVKILPPIFVYEGENYSNAIKEIYKKSSL